MKFGAPSNLHLLWVLLPLLFFLAWGNRKKHELIVRFCGDNLFSKLVTPNLENSKKPEQYASASLSFLFCSHSLDRNGAINGKT